MNNRNHNIIILICLCVFLLSLFSPLKLGAAVKIGSEFQVNTYFYDSQDDSSVAGLSNGGFVVTWTSYLQDGDSSGVYGQRYDSSGNTVGSEFRVNTYTTGGQGDPSAAGLSNGGFVVTWTSDAQDGDLSGVYGQRYNSSGNTVGSEFRVNTYTIDQQSHPSAAELSNGGFVVIWNSNDQDGSSYGIYGQLYDSSGNTVGTEFQVNTITDWSQTGPSVAPLTDDGFVVTWASYLQDGSSYGVYGQRYNSSGSMVGTEFQVNTYTSNGQYCSSVVGLSGGGFVVTWESEYQDGSSNGIYGQLFDESGNKAGTEFQINTHTSLGQFRPSVVSFRGDYFVVTWDSYDQDGSGYGIYAQEFNSSGEKVGNEFRVNTHTPGDQDYPSIAALGDGRFVATWNSWDQDGQFDGIYGQRFITELFGDELAADFGTNGLWHYDGASWSKLATWNPDDDLAGWSGGLAVDFGGNGLWNHDGSLWSILTGWNPGSGGLAGWNGGLAVDFDANGLWFYDGSLWSMLTGWNPGSGGLISWNGSLAVDFGNNGLWIYDGSSWSFLTSWNPEGMTGWNGSLAVDFGNNGLWSYDGSSWSQLTSWNPEGMAGWNGSLAVDFGADGLWSHDGSSWSILTSWNPTAMSGWGNGLAVDFGVNGLWNNDGSSWSMLTSWPCENMADVDLN